MLLNKKIKKLPRIMGGGVIFFKNNSSPITSFGDRSTINTSKYKINNEYSAFSLIELSIVLIIMGLLVAGITGGVSLIDNARITSLKGEVDDQIRDVYTFYARVGRLPGDLDNSGKIGYYSGRAVYPSGSFSAPYNEINNISIVSGPFIELYLYEISSFKPNIASVTTTFNIENATPFVTNGAVPISKKYKNLIFVHRTDVNSVSTDPNHIFYEFKPNEKSIQIVVSEQTRQTLDIAKKIDTKFDDGSHSGGMIRSYCNDNVTMDYGNATYCDEIQFLLNTF
jgi:hypothetical protein